MTGSALTGKGMTMTKEYIVEVTDDIDKRAFEKFERELSSDELVRCKDCKYGDSVKNAKGEPMIECALLYEGWLKEPYWFCADGKKKEEHDDQSI